MFPEPIHMLHQLLNRELPGRKAQFEMAHAGRERTEMAVRDDVRSAAVLILLYPHGDTWYTVFIERKKIKGDRHSGQISFPGGKQEEHETLFETAVREGYEEINSPPDRISRIGALTKLHIPVSNYMVHPFVGYLPGRASFKPQLSEVERILEVPLTRLMTPETRQITSIPLADGFVLDGVPCFALDQHIIWGATAMIISELLSVIAQESSFPELI